MTDKPIPAAGLPFSAVPVKLRVDTISYLVNLLKATEMEFAALQDKRGIAPAVKAQAVVHVSHIRDMIAELNGPAS